jgi:hypothetical protein
LADRLVAAVRIEEAAFSDRRFDRLASLLGLPCADCARGKMAALWRQCTLEQRHVLDEDDVAIVLGPGGADALVAARLGERTKKGVRICGTKGRIEWLGRARSNGEYGKLGGRPRKNNNPAGFSGDNPVGFDGETPITPSPSPSPSIAPATTQRPTSKDQTTPGPLREPEVVDSQSPTALAVRDARRDLVPVGATIEADVLDVFAAYRRHHPRSHPRPKSTSDEWKKIKARLSEGYSVADLIDAVDGCHIDPFSMGENDRRKPFNELELIMRSGSKVQGFIETLAAGPRRPTLAQLPRRDRELAAVMAATDITAGNMFNEFKRVKA